MSNWRIPSLDGLRAIAIILVVLGHLRSMHVAPWPVQESLDRLWSIAPGNLGVRIFFVISGFLITGLLLQEHQRTGGIALGRFYFRRAFRIMPAFYAFLIAIAAASAIHWLAVPSGDLLKAGLYSTDYLGVTFDVGHTWSLAVEEQFYLLWPGLLVLLALRGGFRVALAMLAISPIMRFVALTVPDWPSDSMRGFECVADALATGCLLAYYRDVLWGMTSYRRVMQSPIMSAWPLIVIVIASVGNRVHSPMAATLALSVLNIAIGLGIDWSTRFPTSVIGKWLNARPVAFVGVLSYSIYLWQQPFLESGSPVRFPFNLLAIALCACLSYYIVERPFLRLRARLEARPAALAVRAEPG